MEGSKIPVINDFVESEIERIETSIPKEKNHKGDLEIKTAFVNGVVNRFQIGSLKEKNISILKLART